MKNENPSPRNWQYAKPLVLFSTLLFFLSIDIQAQIIKGRVTEKSGEPIPGVNVVLNGTSLGSITGADGSFQLQSPLGQQVLHLSFIGYQTRDIPIDVNNNSVVELPPITLSSDIIGLEEVVVLGTRRTDRTIIESSVPIDIIDRKQIESIGTTQTVELLQALVPSLNSFKNSITDGTDYVRPINLRGLGSEHVLVLVNGKRRHTSPVVNDNEQNRGSVNVDLNSIPPSAIERIEVLRDGAAAQYGSDAIAGVINIVLKKSSDLNINITYGQNMGKETRGYASGEGLALGESDADFQSGRYNKDWISTQEEITHNDGQSFVAAISKGFSIGKGSIHGSIQLWRQGRSDRAGLDPEYQYFGTLPSGDLTTTPAELDLPTTTLDAREATFDRENWWFGKSELTDVSTFINGDMPLQGQSKIYFFGGISRREGRGPCWWRQPRSNNTVRSVRPNGYLPKITPILQDYSGSVGVKGLVGEWAYDLSQTVAHSDFNFKGETLNVSLGDTANPSEAGLAQQTGYDGGGTQFSQAITNFDISRGVNIGLASPMNLAFGTEYRYEQYQIYAGEPAAYTDGGVSVIGGPNDGTEAVIGTQCVPSFTDLDEQEADRSNIAFYADVEADILQPLTFGAALRYENYTDFGSTLNGKVSSRWAIAEGIAFRASLSTGFRAPALAQQFYSNRSLQPAGDGTLRQTGTFPVNTEVARALGAQELRPEKSTNISGGITLTENQISITMDAYQIDVDDRIILSEQFAGIVDASGTNLLKEYLATIVPDGGITQANFFTNGLNTRTQGLDVIIRYHTDMNINSTLGLTFAANYNRTRITNASEVETPETLKSFSETPLLGHTNRVRMENSAPGSIMNFIIDYSLSSFDVMFKSVYYGSIVTSERFANNRPLYDQIYDGRVINDIELGYRLLDNRMKIALGSNNLFNVYPEKRFKAMSRNGIFPYSGFVPYGFTGRYVYARVSLTL